MQIYLKDSTNSITGITVPFMMNARVLFCNGLDPEKVEMICGRSGETLYKKPYYKGPFEKGGRCNP